VRAINGELCVEFGEALEECLEVCDGVLYILVVRIHVQTATIQ
jgi:hypothetical protein